MTNYIEIFNWILSYIYNNSGFNDESSIIMVGIRDLHDYILEILIFIFIFVSYIIKYIIKSYNPHLTKDLNHNSNLEFIWTIIPIILLLLIVIPSFKLLYFIDEIINTIITLKVYGSQWYWSYSINDLFNNTNLSFSSYMNLELNNNKNFYEFNEYLFKYLLVDNSLYLPILIPIKIIVTSTDVIHSWAIPSLGIKIDGIPGRLNEGIIYILKKGFYSGQCSELCGLNHAYMPIIINAVSNIEYLYWFNNNL